MTNIEEGGLEGVPRVWLVTKHSKRAAGAFVLIYVNGTFPPSSLAHTSTARSEIFNAKRRAQRVAQRVCHNKLSRA